MTAATVPIVDMIIEENVVTKIGMKISLLILCITMNHASPHPNIKPKIISRRNCLLSFLPEASFISRSSNGPVNASSTAKNADTLMKKGGDGMRKDVNVDLQMTF